MLELIGQICLEIIYFFWVTNSNRKIQSNDSERAKGEGNLLLKNGQVVKKAGSIKHPCFKERYYLLLS